MERGNKRKGETEKGVDGEGKGDRARGKRDVKGTEKKKTGRESEK